MSQELNDLTAAMAAEGLAIDSAIVLINGLTDDRAAIAVLAASARARADALDAAVTARTPTV